MASASPTTPLLDIATLANRPTIRIDGEAYEMLHPGELSVLQTMRFVAQARRIDELQSAALNDDPNGDAGTELESIADSIVRAVMPQLRTEVLDKLSGALKLRVAEVFIMLLLQSRLEAAGAMADMVRQATRAMGPTGASLSPGLPDFTAAARENGWKAHLLRWFGRA